MPEIVQNFEVNQPSKNVWEFLQNVPEVVNCIPGFSLIAQEGDNKYRGKVSIRLGPIVGSFEGEATIVESDNKKRFAKIEGQCLDRQGGSRASATVTYQIHDSDNGAIVDIVANLKLTGALAQMGRTGIVQDVADQLTKEFTKNLNNKLISAADNLDNKDIELGGEKPEIIKDSDSKTSISKDKNMELSATKLSLKIFLRLLLRLLGLKKKT